MGYILPFKHIRPCSFTSVSTGLSPVTVSHNTLLSMPFHTFHGQHLPSASLPFHHQTSMQSHIQLRLHEDEAIFLSRFLNRRINNCMENLPWSKHITVASCSFPSALGPFALDATVTRRRVARASLQQQVILQLAVLQLITSNLLLACVRKSTCARHGESLRTLR